MVMRSVLPAFLTATAICGCSTPTHKVELTPPTSGATSVSVIDNRLDPAIFMKLSSGYSAGNFIHIETTPPLKEALASWTSATRQSPTPVRISIEQLDITFKAGFASADDLSCGIESMVTQGTKPPQTIRSRARNTSNRSPLISTAGRLILSECLQAHARDINALVTP